MSELTRIAGSESATTHSQGVSRMALGSSFWVVWKNRRGRAKGVAIVFPASDYAFEMKPNGLSEADRLAACERLAKQLNDAKVRL